MQMKLILALAFVSLCATEGYAGDEKLAKGVESDDSVSSVPSFDDAAIKLLIENSKREQKEAKKEAKKEEKERAKKEKERAEMIKIVKEAEALKEKEYEEGQKNILQLEKDLKDASNDLETEFDKQYVKNHIKDINPDLSLTRFNKFTELIKQKEVFDKPIEVIYCPEYEALKGNIPLSDLRKNSFISYISSVKEKTANIKEDIKYLQEFGPKGNLFIESED